MLDFSTKWPTKFADKVSKRRHKELLQEQQEPRWRRSTVAAGEDFFRTYGMYLIRYVFVTWLQFVPEPDS